MIFDIYDITVGGVTRRYTSAASVLGHDGSNYNPAPISRGSIVMSSRVSDTEVQVTVPVDHEIYRNFLSYEGEMRVNSVSISRLVNGNKIPLFSGEFAKVRVSGGEAVLTAVPRFVMGSQMVPKGVFSRNGWRLPYDDESDFSTNLRVLEVVQPNELRVELELEIGNPVDWSMPHLRYGVIKARGIVTPVMKVQEISGASGEWLLKIADYRIDIEAGDIILGVMGTDGTLEDIDQTFFRAPYFSGFPHLMERD